MHGLTRRQQEILDFITRRIQEQGYPPTIREIGEEMGIRSTNGVNDHLKALERKGHLRREGLKSRALRPVQPHEPKSTAQAELWGEKVGEGSRGDTRRVDAANDARGSDPSSDRVSGQREPTVLTDVVAALVPDGGRTVSVPVLGRVAAGAPILADENIEATVHIDSFFLGASPSDKVFALRVSGESMIEAGILDGDYIFVKKQLEARKGDIVVAMIDGEATVKRYEPSGDVIRFIAENSQMEPIVVRKQDFRSTSILGVVCGVYRRI